VKAVAKAARGEIVVFGGMEITTREEIHILAILDEGDGLYRLEELIESHISGNNDPDRFGEQYVVDEEGYVTDISEVFLAGASDLSVEEVVDAVHHCGGIAIAAHIDRESYSIISQLGFIPETLALDGVEIAKPLDRGGDNLTKHRLPTITSSDAHSPEMIGTAASVVRCGSLSFKEIQAAVAGEGEREIRPIWERSRV
jgi:3',5'-nucleoside bisphosphate phosphatase